MAVENHDDKCNKILFNPPLYMQRYNEVLRICSEMKPKKVADFGCAECKLISLLKREPYIEELFGVDIDEAVLESSSHKIEPLLMDFVNPRSNPLLVKLFQGSVLEYDTRLNGFDIILCVEIIEHLAVKDIPAFTQNLFGNLTPKQVVISTPNSDFNSLFEFKPGQLYRHWDHKFEWSRIEFETWCGNVCSGYGYAVQYIGIGEPPLHEKDLGCCTQMALFTKQSAIDDKFASNGKEIYEVIAEYKHPFKSNADKLKDEILFALNNAVEHVLVKCTKLLEGDTAGINILKLNNSIHQVKNIATNRTNFESIPGQFEDIDDNIQNNTDDHNIYNQKRCPVKVLPFDETSTFAYNLKKWYQKGSIIVADKDQFSDNLATNFNDIYDIKLDDNSNYKLCRFKGNENHDFEKFCDQQTIYCNKNKFKLPIKSITEQTIIKNLPADQGMIINCLKEKIIDHITLTSDHNFIEVSKEKTWTDFESNSSPISTNSKSGSISDYFYEEYWD